MNTFIRLYHTIRDTSFCDVVANIYDEMVLKILKFYQHHCKTSRKKVEVGLRLKKLLAVTQVTKTILAHFLTFVKRVVVDTKHVLGDLV